MQNAPVIMPKWCVPVDMPKNRPSTCQNVPVDMPKWCPCPSTCQKRCNCGRRHAKTTCRDGKCLYCGKVFILRGVFLHVDAWYPYIYIYIYRYIYIYTHTHTYIIYIDVYSQLYLSTILISQAPQRAARLGVPLRSHLAAAQSVPVGGAQGTPGAPAFPGGPWRPGRKLWDKAWKCLEYLRYPLVMSN